MKSVKKAEDIDKHLKDHHGLYSVLMDGLAGFDSRFKPFRSKDKYKRDEVAKLLNPIAQPRSIKTELDLGEEDSQHFLAKYIGCFQRRFKMLFLIDDKYLKTKHGISIMH